MSTEDIFWQVQAVHECDDDPGPGFGYTIGLASRGLPELHIWNRPSHGDDPADDFHLSSRDICSILNQLALEWVAGRLEVGGHRELSLDGGLTTARVTVGAAVAAAEVEAWGAEPSQVVPLRWSLERPARGGPVWIAPSEQHRYERDREQVEQLCDDRVTLVGVARSGDAATFDVGGRYGPLSTLVGAHARAMANTSRMRLLVVLALASEQATSRKALMGHMATLSRMSGRDQQVREVDALAWRAVERLGIRRAWRDEVRAISREMDLPSGLADRNLRDIVGTMFCTALVGVALDDVLPEDVLLAAQGPWRAAMSTTGVDPGLRWRCSASSERHVREVFADLTPRRCLALAEDSADLFGSELESEIMGQAITTAASPPPVAEVVPAACRSLAAYPLVRDRLSTVAHLIVTSLEESVAIESRYVQELEDVLDLSLELPQSWAA